MRSGAVTPPPAPWPRTSAPTPAGRGAGAPGPARAASRFPGPQAASDQAGSPRSDAASPARRFGSRSPASIPARCRDHDRGDHEGRADQVGEVEAGVERGVLHTPSGSQRVRALCGERREHSQADRPADLHGRVHQARGEPGVAAASRPTSRASSAPGSASPAPCRAGPSPAGCRHVGSVDRSAREEQQARRRRPGRRSAPRCGPKPMISRSA